MLPVGLSMLWESAAPVEALADRFGFDGIDEAAAWCVETLSASWGIQVREVGRVVISDHNAILWAATDHGDVVVKWSRALDQFHRLDASTRLLGLLAERGFPVARPLLSASGSARVVTDGPVGKLSLAVLPELAGEWLNVGDEAAVRAAGAVLAELHAALATIRPDAALANEPVDWRSRIAGWLDDESGVGDGVGTSGTASRGTASRGAGSRGAGSRGAGSGGVGSGGVGAGGVGAGGTAGRGVSSPCAGGHVAGGESPEGNAVSDSRDGVAHEAARRLAQALSAAPRLDDAVQLVHNDFRAANILTRGSRIVGVLDFDDVVVTHRVYDLAKASLYLGTLFTDWGPTAPDIRRAFREGYEAVRPLSDAERGWLEILTLWLGLRAAQSQPEPARWLAAL
ncbi:phosphotransferase enzyme family protein [Gryllotalpicola reticulitermitis]|uniref:Phosphotransferase enzyme family protein n=1 Tax=Gryllotalpicola reticulitermitis TaxID=1184153 RepID=A0ABV8Q2T0_9MICO